MKHYFKRAEYGAPIYCAFCKESYQTIAETGDWDGCKSDAPRPTDGREYEQFRFERGDVTNTPDVTFNELEPIPDFKLCNKCICTRPGPKSTCHISGVCQNQSGLMVQWDAVNKRIKALKEM